MRQLQRQRRARNRKYKRYRKYNLKRKHSREYSVKRRRRRRHSRNCNRKHSRNCNHKDNRKLRDKHKLAQRRQRPSAPKARIRQRSLSSMPVMADTIAAELPVNAFPKRQ